MVVSHGGDGSGCFDDEQERDAWGSSRHGCWYLVSSVQEIALGSHRTVADPIKSHDVDGFGAALLDSAVDDACGTHVVRLERSGWLWAAHFE